MYVPLAGADPIRWRLVIVDVLKAVAERRESEELLLEAVGNSSDVTVVRSWGNRGDDLIYAGMRNLLRHRAYRECDIRKLNQAPAGETAIISGGGAWCRPFHAIAELLPEVERRFSRVIIFPSSFDTEELVVRQVLSRTRAVVFARERKSYEQIRGLCDARLAHDTAFFYDFSPYKSDLHQGVLNAFRLDAEAADAPVPTDNRDISTDCDTLDEWLWTISRHELVRTDRAHIVIAAAMLGRSVEWRPSSYHKVPEIVKYSISSSRCVLLKSIHGDSQSRTRREAGRPPSDMESMVRRLEACEGELSSTTAELQESRLSVKALRESWSWRLTAPLRKLMDITLVVRRFLRGHKDGSRS